MPKVDTRKTILGIVGDYCRQSGGEKPFEPGKTRIHYAGRVYDEREVKNAVDACLDFWLTEGAYCGKFKGKLAGFMGTRFCSLVNSGSSANLLALSCLTSKALKKKRLKKGDKVITAAAGFPTTANPIFQNSLTPRFIDVEVGTYNPTPEAVERAIDSRTKAIMLAHTLGNPLDPRIAEIAKERGLYYIEDCCDALGSRINGKSVGSFGDIATLSFYPAHHITTGEGGAVLTSDPGLKRHIESFRDWGRDCWCPPGRDNTCGKRFLWKLGKLPAGYDHKYIYSNIGYNLKMLDIQGAIGLAQMEKLPDFIRRRKENYDFFLSSLKNYSEFLTLPETLPNADISPFGFPMTVNEKSGFTKNQIVEYLESKGIATRMLFGGNLTRQPAYIGKRFDVVGSLRNSDRIMNNTFWIGVYPGITDEMRDYIVATFDNFFSGR